MWKIKNYHWENEWISSKYRFNRYDKIKTKFKQRVITI